MAGSERRKSPSRLKARENEPKNVKPLRRPPAFLSKAERAAYREIVRMTIPGVLGEADSIAVELAARLLVKCRGDEPVMAVEQRLLFSYLGQMGMLPADRGKISIPQPKKKNRFDDDW